MGMREIGDVGIDDVGVGVGMGGIELDGSATAAVDGGRCSGDESREDLLVFAPRVECV